MKKSIALLVFTTVIASTIAKANNEERVAIFGRSDNEVTGKKNLADSTGRVIIFGARESDGSKTGLSMKDELDGRIKIFDQKSSYDLLFSGSREVEKTKTIKNTTNGRRDLKLVSKTKVVEASAPVKYVQDKSTIVQVQKYSIDVAFQADGFLDGFSASRKLRSKLDAIEIKSGVRIRAGFSGNAKLLENEIKDNVFDVIYVGNGLKTPAENSGYTRIKESKESSSDFGWYVKKEILNDKKIEEFKKSL